MIGVFLVLEGYCHDQSLKLRNWFLKNIHTPRNVKPMSSKEKIVIAVVDDGSSDKTAVSTGDNIVLLKHLVNMGKGAAIKTGSDYAVKNGAQKLIYIDADGQHDPKLIPSFLKALETSDIVFGYRHLNRNMPGVLRFGNHFINHFTKLLFDIAL